MGKLLLCTASVVKYFVSRFKKTVYFALKNVVKHKYAFHEINFYDKLIIHVYFNITTSSIHEMHI